MILEKSKKASPIFEGFNSPESDVKVVTLNSPL